MAGYMTKLQGYVYEGELVNGASGAVENRQRGPFVCRFYQRGVLVRRRLQL